MAVTVGGTSITFNDGTTQTTAAGGAPTTTQVLNATAGASLGSVGSYALLKYIGGSPWPAAGGTMVASKLRYAGSQGFISSPTPSGTWRLMGAWLDDCGFSPQSSLWLRIS